MSETDFRWQLSVKLGPGGQHMLNLRADDETEFTERLHWLQSNAEQVLAACAAFTPHAPLAQEPVHRASGPQPTGHAPAPSGSPAAGEIGPVLLTGCEVKQAVSVKSGKPYTKYTFVLGNGMKPTSFDALFGSIGQQHVNRMVYAIVEKNANGYDELKGIRPAA